jgi:hypothetical protein
MWILLLQVFDFLRKAFHYSQDLFGWASGRLIIWFYLFPATFPWAFSPFFPWNEGQSLLGSVHPKIPKDKEMRGWSVESVKYGREWYDDLSRGPSNSKHIPKGDHLLGRNVNHQGETGKRS